MTNESVDNQSLTSMEHRGRANQNLLNFLHTRPAPESLAERNILQTNEPDEFHSAKKSLEKKKKIDTLSTFFRKKVIKKKSMETEGEFTIEEPVVDQIILTLYSTDKLPLSNHKYNHNFYDECFLSGTLAELLVELQFFADSSTAKKFIIYAIKRNIFRSVEPTFDNYTPKLPLRLQVRKFHQELRGKNG
jgi:hypothetical protein